MSRVVLGIDAAWTLHQPSGVAVAQERAGCWRLQVVAPSYESFVSSDAAPDAAALLEATRRRCGRAPDVVAIDMPLSRSPITARRVSDDAVSRAYGARHCSTHTPSVLRPGPISDRLTAGFAREGYGLATERLRTPALIEVYPHPALVELVQAERRLPYKTGKVHSYWPDLNPVGRREALAEVWATIVGRLDGEVEGVAAQLPPPDMTAPLRTLKAYEDMLDAVVCAWVGVCALEGRAQPFGDETSAIWIPVGTLQ